MIEPSIAKVTGFLRNTYDGLQRDAAYPVPAFRITINGSDIAQLISPRLMSLQLTDIRGLEADQLDLTLSDHDGLLVIPPRGAVVRLWLGWSDAGQGMKSEIDEIIWYGGNIQHSLTADAGYTMSLELESKLPEDTVESLLEDGVRGKIKYTGVIAFYRDKGTGKEKSVTAGDQTKPRRLRRVYVNERNARRALNREWSRMEANTNLT
ncbi:hypothetical protein [Pseudomonas putida]|uniref:hypothetical protein n=1 Tax=Pseudomonas putida TaxID=303 RepID=UPI0009A1C1FB|nr:hypothetical protein [Pseudomonas putida]